MLIGRSATDGRALAGQWHLHHLNLKPRYRPAAVEWQREWKSVAVQSWRPHAKIIAIKTEKQQLAECFTFMSPILFFIFTALNVTGAPQNPILQGLLLSSGRVRSAWHGTAIRNRMRRFTAACWDLQYNTEWGVWSGGGFFWKNKDWQGFPFLISVFFPAHDEFQSSGEGGRKCLQVKNKY